MKKKNVWLHFRKFDKYSFDPLNTSRRRILHFACTVSVFLQFSTFLWKKEVSVLFNNQLNTFYLRL